MIPIAAIAELVGGVIATVRWIRGLLPDEEQILLRKWHKIILEMPKSDKEDELNEWWKDMLQFIAELTLRRGFSPAYQYKEFIAVPVDMLTDLTDILIGGWSAGSQWNPRNLLRNPEKDRLSWRDVYHITSNDQAILDEADVWIARRGRCRSYTPIPAIRVDRDWFADAIAYLVG